MLGSVSTNIARQLAYERNENIASASVLTANHLRCSQDKCSSYFHPLCHENVQHTGVIQGMAKEDQDHDNDDGSNHNSEDACEMGCDGKDYDYDTILAKILNEKKLVSTQMKDFVDERSKSCIYLTKELTQLTNVIYPLDRPYRTLLKSSSFFMPSQIKLAVFKIKTKSNWSE